MPDIIYSKMRAKTRCHRSAHFCGRLDGWFASVEGGELAQVAPGLFAQLTQLLRPIAPGPIPLALPRRVESRVGPEIQQIGKRNDREIGDRLIGEPDEIPGDFLAADPQVTPDMIAGFLVDGSIPASRGVVVVRAGVHDTVGPVIMGKV